MKIFLKPITKFENNAYSRFHIEILRKDDLLARFYRLNPKCKSLANNDR